MANIELIDIVAPQLSNSNYGRGVKDQFDNIDKNFKTLGNHDFVKGDSGSGYNFKLVTLTSELPPAVEPADEWSDEWVNYKIKTVILDNLEESDDKSTCISTLDGQVVMVYYLGASDSEEKEYVGIQPFPFYDGRLKGIAGLTVQDAENFSDQTGIICTNIESDEVVFQVLQGFPTIYYDENVGSFCWNIGGQETGLPAQGPQGIQGASGYTLLVETESTTYGTTGKYKINSIYICNEGDGHYADGVYGPVPVEPDSEAQRIIDELYENSVDRTATAFVIDQDNNHMYLSPVITIWDETLGSAVGLVIKDQYTELNLELNNDTIENWFKTIDKDNNNSVYHRGVFIPYVPGMSSNNGAHVMFAEPISGSTNKKLVIEPVANISDLSSPDSSAQIEIRYPSMTMQSSTSSVKTVFDRLYTTGDGVSSEQRFTYIWQSEPKSGSYTPPGTAENRAAYNTYDQATHPFQAFMCPDGFLWYKDPYTYLRVELQAGKVMIVGPDNSIPASGVKNISPAGTQASPIQIPAAETSATASLGADSYWSITKTT